MQINWIVENDTIKSVDRSNNNKSNHVFQFGNMVFGGNICYIYAYFVGFQTKFSMLLVLIGMFTLKAFSILSKPRCMVLTVRFRFLVFFYFFLNPFLFRFRGFFPTESYSNYLKTLLKNISRTYLQIIDQSVSHV